MPYIAKELSHFSLREIKAFFKKGMRIYRSDQLDIIALPAGKSFGRILVVTPRKVGSAPERNRVRRRLKALFYQKGWYNNDADVCIIIKPAGAHLTSQMLESLLQKVLPQI